MFELDLLRALGYGLELDGESATGEPLREELRYVYELEQGFRRAEHAESDAELYPGRDLIALRDLTLDDEASLRTAQRLLGRVLRAHLGERPLQEPARVAGHRESRTVVTFMEPVHLGVNVDHVATLRQARGTRYPDPVAAALIAEQAGADSITVHLREDRRHIQARDVEVLLRTVQTRVNLEMAVTDSMVDFAIKHRPADCCLVPERREELTTEGGLDVAGQTQRIAAACRALAEHGVRVSLFIDPDTAQIEASAAAGAPVVELHTGAYAEAAGAGAAHELARIEAAAERARALGLVVHAGHGLNYHNVMPVAAMSCDRRAQHRPRDRRAGAVRRFRGRRRQDEGAHGGCTRVIFGIGTDVLQAERVEKTWQRFGEHFARRLLLDEELALFAKAKRPVRFLAMRFAAKEAIVKALGTGFANGIWVRDVGMLPNKLGQPQVIYSERGRALCRKLGVGEGHLTLSDEAGLIVAVAVLMRAAPEKS